MVLDETFDARSETEVRDLVEPRGIEPLTSCMPFNKCCFCLFFRV
jgi:hypothetical protein